MEPVDPTAEMDDPDPDGVPADHSPDRRVFLGVAGLAGLVIVGGGGLVAYLASRPDDPAPVALPDPTTTTTRPPAKLQVTASTLPPLPVPDPLPADPYAATPQVVLGTIAIDRIGVVADMQEGITLTAINRGPGHWPGTALPGALGNAVFAGHRTTYSKPFNRLNELQPGDPVVMTTAEGTFTYQVRGVVIVPGEAIDIADQAYAHTATLFACHPPGSARQRIVAKLRLLSATGAPVDSDAVLPPLDAGTQETDHTLMVKSSDPLAQADG